jgi:hypothetical protein
MTDGLAVDFTELTYVNELDVDSGPSLPAERALTTIQVPDAEFLPLPEDSKWAARWLIPGPDDDGPPCGRLIASAEPATRQDDQHDTYLLTMTVRIPEAITGTGQNSRTDRFRARVDRQGICGLDDEADARPMGEDEMTATSISMPDTGVKAFKLDVYANAVLATTERYALFSDRYVHKPLPAWQEHLLGRLADLERLVPNWDSDGALPVSRRHANRAQAFLTRVMGPMSVEPEVVPFADGGVQLEWRFGNGGRLDFVTDEEEPDGVVLFEVAGELSTVPAAQAVDEVRSRLGQSLVSGH